MKNFFCIHLISLDAGVNWLKINQVAVKIKQGGFGMKMGSAYQLDSFLGRSKYNFLVDFVI